MSIRILKVTIAQIVGLIRQNVKGTTIVTIETETDPRMRKTGNPYANKGVIKKQTLNGVMGFDYEAGVNRRAEKEGKEADRTAQPRKWGVLMPDRLFVTHKGSYYLQLQCEGVSNRRFELPDGTEVPESEIKSFIPDKEESSIQSDIENKLIIRDVKMENVRSITFKGTKYEIVSETAEIEDAQPSQKGNPVKQATPVNPMAQVEKDELDAYAATGSLDGFPIT